MESLEIDSTSMDLKEIVSHLESIVEEYKNELLYRQEAQAYLTTGKVAAWEKQELSSAEETRRQLIQESFADFQVDVLNEKHNQGIQELKEIFKNYNIWNSLLYGKAKKQENLQTLLNCTCFNAETKGERIEKINAKMAEYVEKGLFETYKDCFIYIGITGGLPRRGKSLGLARPLPERLKKREIKIKTEKLKCHVQILIHCWRPAYTLVT